MTLRKKLLWAAITAAYFSGSLVTFAYLHQHVLSGATDFKQELAGIGAWFWPIYWLGRLAFIITEGWTF